MTRRRPVVVLSCHTIGLGVIRALGRKGIPIIAVRHNRGDMGQVSKFVKETVHAPDPEKAPDHFLECLIGCGERYPNSLLIPADDATLEVVSQNKGLLSRYFVVACTDWGVTELFLNKSKTYELASRCGIPIARTHIPASLIEAIRVGKEMEYPCLVKPCFSHRHYELFHRKITIVKNLEEMASAYREASDAGIAVMLQEFIPGDDSQGVNYNSYFVDGLPMKEFTASKVRLSPALVGVPSVVVSRHVPEVLESGRRILSAMKFDGYSCTEFKRDPRDGIFKLLEVNGRHNRSSLLAVECGINFPWIQYTHMMGEALPQSSHAREDVYWIDEFKDLSNLSRREREKTNSRVAFFSPYLKSHVFAVFDWRDPLPFLKRCIDGGKLMGRKMSGRFFSSPATGS